MPRRTSGSRTGSATPAAAAAAPSNSSSSADSVAAVVPKGNRLRSLVALRNRLAAETDDTKWMKHKAECHCVCGMGDGRLLVALTKELRSVIAEIESLPETEGESPLDAVVDRVSELDDARRRRTVRGSAAAGS